MMEINANYRKIQNLLRQHEQIHLNSKCKIRNAKLMFAKLPLNVGVKRRNLFMVPVDLHPDKAMLIPHWPARVVT